MVKAGEIMTKDVISVRPEVSVLEVVQLLTKHGISGLPVTDHDGILRGVITEKDVLRLLVEETQPRSVEDYMTKDVESFRESDYILDICRFFIKSHVRRVPIIDESGKLLGIVSRRDIISEIQRIRGL